VIGAENDKMLCENRHGLHFPGMQLARAGPWLSGGAGVVLEDWMSGKRIPASKRASICCRRVRSRWRRSSDIVAVEDARHPARRRSNSSRPNMLRKILR